MLTFVSKVTMINSDGSLFGLYDKLTNSLTTDTRTVKHFNKTVLLFVTLKTINNDC